MKSEEKDSKKREVKTGMWLGIILGAVLLYWFNGMNEKKTEEDLCNAMNEKIAEFAPALQSGQNFKELNDEMEEIYGVLTSSETQWDYEHNMTAPRGKAAWVGEKMARKAAERGIERMHIHGSEIAPSKITQVARFYVILEEYEKYLQKYASPDDNFENL